MDADKHLFKSQSFIELIQEAINFMNSTPVEALPPEDRFLGGGIYALYYAGRFPGYREVYEKKTDLPIYVGKAVLPGWRQGRGSDGKVSAALYSRLREHSRSIDLAENLELEDFSCRFMILRDREADLISTVEATLTRLYNPLWNSHLDGFGNHDPGKGRYQQAKSEWDVLHPGRKWAEKLTGIPPELAKIEEKISKYYELQSA